MNEEERPLADQRTVGEALEDVLPRSVTPLALAALGLDPSTPLANVVALRPGQHVVRERSRVELISGSFSPHLPFSERGFVIVRSAVPHE